MTETFFSQTGIHLVDFIQISAGFILAMLVFFGVNAKRYSWLNWFVLAAFGLQCVLIIVLRVGLNTRLFAGLMFFSTLIVEAIVLRRKKLTRLSR